MCQHLENQHYSSTYQMTSEWCHKIMYGLREHSKVKKRPIDFNITENKKFLCIVSGPRL